jgi:phosphotransferase system HPr-like phosphotransfer protein
MGYGNNNYQNGGGRGGYSQGGRNQNGGGRGGYGGGNRSYGGGGGNFRGGNRGDDGKYVKSSSFVWDHVEDTEAKGQDKVKIPYSVTPGQGEEISVSLTAAKAQQLLEKIQDAIGDQQGDGGIRMTLYVQHKVNKETNEEFDGASILVVGKFPARNGGGNRGGGYGGNSRNGRRDYPDNRGNANGDTQQYGNRDSTQGNGTQNQSNNSQNAMNDASHSDDQQYSEKPGW